MFAMAFIGMAVSCTDDDNNNNGGNNGGNNNNNDPNGYSAMLVGEWQVDEAYVNDEPFNMFVGIRLSFTANGQGLMNDGGVTNNNDFTWQINGENITINTHHETMFFTIIQMNDQECSFRGTSLEMDGQQITGTIIIHMVKVSNPGPGPGPQPTDNVLMGAPFGFEFSFYDEEAGQISFSITVTFSTATTGNIHYDDGEENYTLPFTYTFEETGYTGMITMVIPGEGTEYIEFNYNPSTDELTIINPEYDPTDPDDMPQYTLPRINNN